MPEWISVLLSALAIVVSIWTAVRQQRIQSRMAAIELERRSEEISAKGRADVTAFFEPRLTTSGFGRSLVLENRGQAPARGVSFEIIPVGGGDSPLLMGTGLEPNVPLIDVKGRYAWPAEFASGTASAIDVEIEWTDDAGQQTKTLRLSAFG